jgi:hypothetical protein
VESSLSLAYQELVGEVGTYLGYGRGPSYGDPAFTTQQQNVLDSVIKSGIRQFYFPPPIEGTTSPTDWSFLHPTASMDLPVNTSIIKMPDDFGGFEGEVTILPVNSTVWWPIALRNEGFIRAQYSLYPQMVGRPMTAALAPIKGTTYNASNRWELLVFPVSDQDYTLQFMYYILPDYLSGALPYAYGGAAHAETLLESCLAIAEQKLQDTAAVHTMKFKERLMASVGMDRKHKAQNLGYNGDRSDCRNRRWGPFWHFNDTILVNGIAY